MKMHVLDFTFILAVPKGMFLGSFKLKSHGLKTNVGPTIQLAATPCLEQALL